MLARELFNLRSILQKEGIIFAYSGYLTEAVLSGVGEAVKHKLALEDTDTKTQRSVFAVFVEQVQNMIRYSAARKWPIPERLCTHGGINRARACSSPLATPFEPGSVRGYGELTP
jgi:hypothetical protein